MSLLGGGIVFGDRVAECDIERDMVWIGLFVEVSCCLDRGFFLVVLGGGVQFRDGRFVQGILSIFCR